MICPPYKLPQTGAKLLITKYNIKYFRVREKGTNVHRLKPENLRFLN
jgi:hypothetical protein